MRQLPTQLMVIATASGLALASLAGCATHTATDAAIRDAVEAQNERVAPERAVRELMIAWAKGDREGMLAHMKPNADVGLMLQMGKPKDEAKLVALFPNLPITRLNPGDQLADPFVPGQRIIPEMIDEDHLVLSMHTLGKDTWTFFVVREDGQWRVDMDWFIEALKHPGSKPRIVV